MMMSNIKKVNIENKLAEVLWSYLEVTSFMQNPFAKFSQELLITWLFVSVIQKIKTEITKLLVIESMFH